MEMGRRDMLLRRGGGTNPSSNKKSGSVVSPKHKKKRTMKKVGSADADDDERMNHKKKREMMMMMCYDFPSSDLDNQVVVSKNNKKKKKKKSSKLLKNSLKEESNGVVHPPHASVPRKLRSAMQKRNLESVSNHLSSPSKRLNMDLVEKNNQETDAKAIVSESIMKISKDEEEVAETLFGLADMFKETASVDNNKTCDDPFLSDDDDKETTKADSVTTKDESLEPAVSLLSSDKTKQLDEVPQSSSLNVSDAPVSTKPTTKAAATSDMEYKSNGLALWPGLSSTVQSGPSSTNLPPWMGQAVSSPAKNASPLSIRPRKLKRCASHIYICRLIKALQTEQRSPETSQCRLPEPVTTVSDFKSNVAPTNRFQNPHLIDLHKTCDPKPVQEDKTQLCLDLYGPHTTQKQSYDFLSLSSTGASQSHLPFTNSYPQHPPISAPYNSQLSPSLPSHQMQQMSPYLANRLQTAYNANQQQQQQLQKRMWAAHQYRPLTSGNTAPASTNHYSKPNLSLNLASIQPLHVASSPRYNNNNVYQQQRRLMSAAAAMSMSHHHNNNNNNRSRMVMNRQEHHFPLIYEDTTRTPFQLLCNEQS